METLKWVVAIGLGAVLGALAIIFVNQQQANGSSQWSAYGVPENQTSLNISALF